MTGVSIEKAAEILGVSPKTIHRHRQRGALRVGDQGWGSGVALDDVEALRRIGGEAGVDPDAGALITLKQSIDEQATRLARLRWIMGGGTDRPALHSLERMALWEHARAGTGPGWPPHIEPSIADWLGRVRLTDLRAVSESGGDPHPWRPLLRLARTLLVAAYIVELRPTLAIAAERITQLAQHWCAAHGVGPRETHVLLRGACADGWFVRRRHAEERRAERASLPFDHQAGAQST